MAAAASGEVVSVDEPNPDRRWNEHVEVKLDRIGGAPGPTFRLDEDCADADSTGEPGAVIYRCDTSEQQPLTPDLGATSSAELSTCSRPSGRSRNSKTSRKAPSDDGDGSEEDGCRRSTSIRSTSVVSKTQSSIDSTQRRDKSEFIRAVTADAEATTYDSRSLARRILLSQPVEWGCGAVILANFIVIVIETDWKAQRGEDMPKITTILNHAFFSVYCLELSLRLFAFRLKAFNSMWMVLDSMIVGAGLLELGLQLIGESISAGTTLRAVRLIRVMRLLRALRVLGALKELRKLLEMMTSCMKTLFWSFLLCFMVMSIWSIVAVELLGDIVADMHDQGFWPDCDVCSRYFTSVMHCNLFFFQTIIAGDSWGMISVPVTERHPWALIVFCGALLSIIFGVLNLVVAVVVDTFADLRSRDLSYMAMEMEMEELEEKKQLYKLFEQIDADNSGEVTYQELEDAAHRVPGFRQRLRVLDIDRADLRQLFALIDRDGSGEIDPEEFIETLYRVKNTESKTATKIIKHYVMHMLPQIQEEQKRVKESVRGLQMSTSIVEDQITKVNAIESLLPGIEARQQGVEKDFAKLLSAKGEAGNTVLDLQRQIAKHEDTIREELLSVGRHLLNALEKPPPPPSTAATLLRARPRPNTCANSSDDACPRGSDGIGSHGRCHSAAGCARDTPRTAAATLLAAGAAPPRPLEPAASEEWRLGRPQASKVRPGAAGRFRLNVGAPRQLDLKQDTPPGLPVVESPASIDSACAESSPSLRVAANGVGGNRSHKAVPNGICSESLQLPDGGSFDSGVRGMKVLNGYEPVGAAGSHGDSCWRTKVADSVFCSEDESLSEACAGS